MKAKRKGYSINFLHNDSMFSILQRFITNFFMDLNKPLSRFLIKAVVLYLGWHLLWYNWIEPDGTVNHYLTTTQPG